MMGMIKKDRVLVVDDHAVVSQRVERLSHGI